MVINRLRGEYRVSAATANRAAKKMKGSAKPISIEQRPHLHLLMAAYSPHWEAGGYGQHYELADGFASVLDECAKEYGKYTTIIMSDNMRRSRGDVHTGIFSTKNFMEWFIDEELGLVTTPEDTVDSHTDTNAPLRVWIINPDWTKIETLFAPARERILTKIEEANRGRKDKTTKHSIGGRIQAPNPVQEGFTTQAFSTSIFRTSAANNRRTAGR